MSFFRKRSVWKVDYRGKDGKRTSETFSVKSKQRRFIQGLPAGANDGETAEVDEHSVMLGLLEAAREEAMQLVQSLSTEEARHFANRHCAYELLGLYVACGAS